MNNIGLEIVFWTVLSVYLLAKAGVFKKSNKKSYSRRKKKKMKCASEKWKEVFVVNELSFEPLKDSCTSDRRHTNFYC